MLTQDHLLTTNKSEKSIKENQLLSPTLTLCCSNADSKAPTSAGSITVVCSSKGKYVTYIWQIYNNYKFIIARAQDNSKNLPEINTLKMSKVHLMSLFYQLTSRFAFKISISIFQLKTKQIFSETFILGASNSNHYILGKTTTTSITSFQ